MTLLAPIAHGLDRDASGIGNGFRAIPERLENLIDYMHGAHNIRVSDNCKGPCYLFSTDALSVLSCQKPDMDEPAFDRDRIRDAMREQKVTQTAMAKIMRLTSQSAFSNIMNGKRKVTVEEAKLAYDFLGFKAEPSIQWVPIIGIANAGNWREAIHMPMGSLPVRIGSVSDEAFAVEVAGDSMDLLIPDGGHIIIDPRQKELRDGKVYLIQNGSNETTVKAYFRSPARFEPVSSNQDHKGWLVSDQDFIVLGRVIKKVEDL